MRAYVGDVVHLRAKVRHIYGHGGLEVMSIPGGFCFTTVGDDIIHVEPRPLQAGDWAWLSDKKVQVRSVEDGLAWVRYLDGERSTVLIDHLKRVDPSP